ncbi:MAG: hypothetical protein IPJ71_03130 [Bdellovibrionales bacterium]|nr:hypothetical protein [Bdellovibrionales bacterium]
MEKLFGNSDSGIRQYVQNLLKPEDTVLASARKECLQSGMPDIQVSELDGRHLEVLVRMARAKKAVEIGTLGGYSGIFLIRGMGASGHLYTFELSPAHAQVAHRNFKAAGLDGQVTQYVGPQAILNIWIGQKKIFALGELLSGTTLLPLGELVLVFRARRNLLRSLRCVSSMQGLRVHLIFVQRFFRRARASRLG